MTATDLGRLRFAYSPLGEVAESLSLLASGSVPELHRPWFTAVRDSLRHTRLELLLTAVPARGYLPDFLISGAGSPQTTIEQQLQLVTELSGAQLAREFEAAWRGERIPPVLQGLVAEGNSGARRLADALWSYWSAAIAPYWRELRAVFDDDVAHRATALTKGGVGAMLAELHPEVSMHGEQLRIDQCAGPEGDLTTAGVLLVPSVFCWPYVAFAVGADGPACLTYPARGIGNVWNSAKEPAPDDALGALLGRSRAGILSALELARSTTELALELGQSPPAVSQHLAVLRRNGLVFSWRSGRSVYYRRTPLGDSIAAAGSWSLDASPTGLPCATGARTIRSADR